MEKKDYFSIFELHFLINFFQGRLLPGLPSREALPLSTRAVWKEAKDTLFAKNMVDEAGNLTEEGYAVTETLREYCSGQALTIINDFYIVYSEETDSCIVISETSERYQILKFTPVGLLAFLQEKLPFLLRKPSPDEKNFLTQEVYMTDELEEVFGGEDVVIIHHCPMLAILKPQYHRELSSYLLVAEFEGKLLVDDVKEGGLFRYSQYYILERLYKWLSIPFREEDL